MQLSPLPVDQVLVGEGPGVPPVLYLFVRGDSLALDRLKAGFTELIAHLATGTVPGRRSGPMLGATLKVVVVVYFENVAAFTAKRLARLVPDSYYPNLRPQVWVADLEAARLYLPSRVTLWLPAGPQAVQTALAAAAAGAFVGSTEIDKAQEESSDQRTLFVQRLRRNVPYVTYALLGAIWAVFGLESAYPGGSLAPRTLLHFGALQPVLVEHGELWLLLTAMFVHIGFLHITFNSIALYSVGTLVERIYGSLRYAIIYFVSGILSSATSYAWMVSAGETTAVAAGASGAIFGIAGVLIVLGLLRRSPVPRAVALQLSITMMLLITANIIFDVFSPEIDLAAHLGGLVFGVILGFLFAPRSIAGTHGTVSADVGPGRPNTTWTK